MRPRRASRRRSQAKKITVVITPGNPPKLQPSGGIRISKAGKDEVAWKCSRNFRVLFDKGTPFRRAAFNKRTSRSGPAQFYALEGGKYKYTVIAKGKLDPRVIIDP
jgi:hypothetical protein